MSNEARASSFHRDRNSTYDNVTVSLFFTGPKAFVQDCPPHRPENDLLAEDREDFKRSVSVEISCAFDRRIQAVHVNSAWSDSARAFMPNETHFGSRKNIGLVGNP